MGNYDSSFATPAQFCTESSIKITKWLNTIFLLFYKNYFYIDFIFLKRKVDNNHILYCKN